MAWFPILAPGRGTPYDPGPLQVPRPRPHRPPSWPRPGNGPSNNRGSKGTSSGGTGSGRRKGAGSAARRQRQGDRAAAARPAAAKGPVPGPAARVASPAGTVLLTRLGHYGDHHRRRPPARRGPGVRPRLQHQPVSARAATAAAAMLAQANALPPGLIHEFPDSNAWAANGPKVAGGEVDARRRPAPAADACPRSGTRSRCRHRACPVTGVSVPGLPGVLDRPQRPHRLVASPTRAEPGHAVLRRADQRRAGRAEYFWRGALAPDAAGALHDPGPRAGRRPTLTVEQHRARPGHDAGGPDHVGGLDGRHPAPPDISAMMRRRPRAASFAQFRAGAGGPGGRRRRTSSTPTTAATSVRSRAGYYPQAPATDRLPGCRCRAPAAD